MALAATLKVKVGAPLPFNQVRTVKGKIVTLNAKAEPASAPPPTPFVHLQLARFSGCPICNLKLREYSRSADELRAAGIEVVIVMHSTAALILENQGSVDWTQSFDWVADPTYELYELTGAKNMPFWRVLLSPTATYWAVRSFWVGTYYGRLFSGEWWRRTVKGEKNLSQIPLDLMIDTRDGNVVALGYGPTVASRWTAAQTLEARKAAPP